MVEDGELFPPSTDSGEVDFSGDYAFGVAGFGKRGPFWVEDDGAPTVFKSGVLARSVDAHHVGEVLDCTGLEQCEPVVDAYGRPVGDDEEEVGPFAGADAEDFGEAEVVADEGAGSEPARGKVTTSSPAP